MIQPLLTLFTVFYLYLSQNTVHAARNITIDDTSSDINYYGGAWTVASYQEDYGGSEHLVDLGPDGSGFTASFASFTFTGMLFKFLMVRG
jgi:hypothetical protein